ncbi:MAG TPA: SO2930 family diheme c-type cytochrome [Steroidobacteraceae bacterium]|nr:SO2930 family diheme c-type cytochrome [Steroidobacteraceae bacterium]
MPSRLLFWLLAALAASACHQAPRTGLDYADEFPERLSEWRLLLQRDGKLVPNEGVTPYDLNSPLFSDYAHKLRTVVLPPGTSIRYGDDAFEFPVGTVITKTFYYPRGGEAAEGRIAVRKVLAQEQGVSLDLAQVRLLETRLLINTAAGWVAIPYVWNAQQTEATLALAGDTLSLELVSDAGRQPFAYLVPDTNQCAGCHALEHHSQKIEPIGIRARHLNKTYRYGEVSENQIAHWQKTGLLTGAPDPLSAPRNAQWDDADSDLEARARAYLDVNCGHCHRPRGAASTSGLLLHAQETDRVKLGECKIPIATGRGSGDALFDIVPGTPDQSILLHRMLSTEADVAMPELGRSLVHAEGVALIRDWIASLRGGCSAPR